MFILELCAPVTEAMDWLLKNTKLDHWINNGSFFNKFHGLCAGSHGGRSHTTYHLGNCNGIKHNRIFYRIFAGFSWRVCTNYYLSTAFTRYIVKHIFITKTLRDGQPGFNSQKGWGYFSIHHLQTGPRGLCLMVQGISLGWSMELFTHPHLVLSFRTNEPTYMSIPPYIVMLWCWIIRSSC